MCGGPSGVVCPDILKKFLVSRGDQSVSGRTKETTDVL
jgi:hypothetical protein